MTDPVRVLLVEDSPDDAFLVERALEKGGMKTRTRRVETREEMADALRADWDVVLADYGLPAFDALEALKMVRERGGDVPFLVVTGTIGEERAAHLLRSGADDFLLKDKLGRLVPAVERELRDVALRRERKAAQEELEMARARYRALIESASDVIFIVDADGTVRFVSPSVEKLVGLSPSELVGKNAFRVVHPEDLERVRRELSAVVGGERRRAEYRIVRPDGGERFVESVATNLMDREAVGGIVVNTRDLTERKGLEKQLLQAQKMEAIGRLAGGIAHDFNNLLTVISGNTRILIDGLDDAAPEKEDARQVLSAAERASSLTRQLLAFSRHQVLNPQVVDVGQVTEGVQDMIQRLMGEDIRLTVSTPARPVFSRVDPVQLEQVLMNLAVNARDAMPKGGAVTISLESRSSNDLLMDLAEPDDARWARLTFRDTGPGIPPEVRDRIFEPFYSTKEMGTGLGLSTVYGIVRQSGGQVRFECPPGGGTVFVVALPELDDPQRPAQAPAQVETATGDGGRGERILLVEDSPDVRRVARRILERDGFRVTEAGTGSEALELVRSDGDLRLLITDLVMPGMPGPRLARQVRELRPDMPVLFMSGYSGDEYLEPRELETAGAFLAKPFTPKELSDSVRRLLDASGP